MDPLGKNFTSEYAVANMGIADIMQNFCFAILFWWKWTTFGSCQRWSLLTCLQRRCIYSNIYIGFFSRSYFMKSVCIECPNCLITESFIEQQGFSRLSTCSDVARAVPKVFGAAKKHRRPRIQATMTTNVFYFSFIPEKERQRHGKTGDGKLFAWNLAAGVHFLSDFDCAGRKLLGCCSRFNDGRLVEVLEQLSKWLWFLACFSSFHCRATTWHMWTFNCLDYFWPFSFPFDSWCRLRFFDKNSLPCDARGNRGRESRIGY